MFNRIMSLITYVQPSDKSRKNKYIFVISATREITLSTVRELHHHDLNYICAVKNVENKDHRKDNVYVTYTIMIYMIFPHMIILV